MELVSGVFLQVQVDNKHLLLSHSCTPAAAESTRHSCADSRAGLNLTQGRFALHSLSDVLVNLHRVESRP